MAKRKHLSSPDEKGGSTPYSPDWKAKFLAALAESPNVTRAAKLAGITRTYVYAVRGEDKEFALAWDNALEAAIDNAIGEVYRRGVEGVEEPIFYQGKESGAVRKYSDNLLMFLVKAHRPEYRDSVKTDNTHKVEVVGLADVLNKVYGSSK